MGEEVSDYILDRLMPALQGAYGVKSPASWKDFLSSLLGKLPWARG